MFSQLPVIAVVLAALTPVALSSPTLEARQTPPSIKQTVSSTWEFRGCRKDIGERILTFRFDVPAGNNAERCVEICDNHGYGLAGLEYGSECWCDNYMPYGDVMPDSDCNFVCPGDSTQLCGAGNRLVLYENTAGTPPSTSSCINWRGHWTFGNTVLHAVPRVPNTGPTTKLFAIPTNPFTDPIYYTIISTCPTGCVYSDYYNFPLVDGILQSYNSRPIAPNVGDSQAFIFKWPQTVVGHNAYCAKPNPISPEGPFIGHPLLSVNGDVDEWALCTNITANDRLDIVYSPVANHAHYDKDECQEVYIEIGPYA